MSAKDENAAEEGRKENADEEKVIKNNARNTFDKIDSSSAVWMNLSRWLSRVYSGTTISDLSCQGGVHHSPLQPLLRLQQHWSKEGILKDNPSIEIKEEEKKKF